MIAERLQKTLGSIRAAEQQYGRQPNSVTLLLVSKAQSTERVLEAFQAGQRAFAENYVQEALTKQSALRHLDIEWHFIGNIQLNKTKYIAEHFSWVHSVSRLSIAKKLNQYRPASLAPLNICIEVNIDREKNKHGLAPEQLLELATAIKSLPNLTLRGCMVIPQPTTNSQAQAAAFQRVATLQAQLIQSGFLLDTLSMGMSTDFEIAIKMGSTLVRIGTLVFDNRK